MVHPYGTSYRLLSTDVKPSAPDGVWAIEENTGQVYRRIGGAWVLDNAGFLDSRATPHDSAGFVDRATVIPTTDLSASPATGLCHVSYYLVTTLSGGGAAGKLALRLLWDDGSSSQNTDSAKIDLSQLGSFVQGIVIARTNASVVSYRTLLNGSFHGAKYSLWLDCVSLS